jgi:hypothetical protein
MVQLAQLKMAPMKRAASPEPIWRSCRPFYSIKLRVTDISSPANGHKNRQSWPPNIRTIPVAQSATLCRFFSRLAGVCAEGLVDLTCAIVTHFQ